MIKWKAMEDFTWFISVLYKYSILAESEKFCVGVFSTQNKNSDMQILVNVAQ